MIMSSAARELGRGLLAWVVLGLTVNQASGADTSQSHTSRVEQSRLSTSLMDEHSVQLSADERAQARKWRLTNEDWVKYKTIMSGPRGVWSPDVDPITALGVMETDPDERRRYAEIWMAIETRRAQLELAFEVERMEAAKRLNGQQPLIKNQQWKQQWQANQRRVKHEVMLFVDVDCTKACERLFAEVQKTTDDRSRLDVYFAPGTTADQIGAWAAEMKLDPEVVRNREVTLNFDRGMSAQLGVSMNELPEVHVRNTTTGVVRETFTRW